VWLDEAPLLGHARRFLPLYPQKARLSFDKLNKLLLHEGRELRNIVDVRHLARRVRATVHPSQELHTQVLGIFTATNFVEHWASREVGVAGNDWVEDKHSMLLPLLRSKAGFTGHALVRRSNPLFLKSRFRFRETASKASVPLRQEPSSTARSAAELAQPVPIDNWPEVADQGVSHVDRSVVIAESSSIALESMRGEGGALGCVGKGAQDQLEVLSHMDSELGSRPTGFEDGPALIAHEEGGAL
jgi:hypothetical protein